MNVTPRTLVVMLVPCVVLQVAAQPGSPTTKEEPTEPLPSIFVPRVSTTDGKLEPAKSVTPASAPQRAVSPEMAAKLATVVTRMVAAASTDPKAAPPPRDSSATVQLPPYVVRAERLPAFKDREILTSKGMLALARHRYPQVLTNGAALRLLGEDFARERRQEVADYKGLIELGGGTLSPDMKRKIKEMVNRPLDMPREWIPPPRL